MRADASRDYILIWNCLFNDETEGSRTLQICPRDGGKISCSMTVRTANIRRRIYWSLDARRNVPFHAWIGEKSDRKGTQAFVMLFRINPSTSVIRNFDDEIRRFGVTRRTAWIRGATNQLDVIKNSFIVSFRWKFISFSRQ